MKKILLYGTALTLAVSLMGCSVKEKNDAVLGESQNQIEEQINTEETEKEVIINLVKDFGNKLKLVSLLAPEDTLKKEMKENYSDLVSDKLIEKWISNPENAPGRLTSSPWPDRIEVKDVEKVSESEYKVEGKIIEITSDGKDENISREITLNVRKIDEKWIIDEVVLSEYE